MVGCIHRVYTKIYKVPNHLCTKLIILSERMERLRLSKMPFIVYCRPYIFQRLECVHSFKHNGWPQFILGMLWIYSSAPIMLCIQRIPKILCKCCVFVCQKPNIHSTPTDDSIWWHIPRFLNNMRIYLAYFTFMRKIEELYILSPN